MILRTTSPFTRINNDIVLSPTQRMVMTTHSTDFIGKNFTSPNIIGGTNDQSNKFNAEFLHSSFVYIITETVGDYPYPYFSEKTWKAIITGCPFMMVNARNSLAKLNEFGFKTFNTWWDESYDTKTTVADRIEAMVTELNKFSNKSVLELQKMREEIVPVIEYNKQHLKKFTESDLKNITDMI